MQGKWALEEHLSTPENNQLWDDSGEAARNGRQYMDYVESHLLDVDERIKIMDATGIDRSIVSLTSPGIQSITDTGVAVKVARDTNDLVKRGFVDQRPDRLSMFACLPTQDGAAAAAELRRAVGELGAVGALINGYTNVGDASTGRYLDDDAYEPLWAAVENLGVPVYLRAPARAAACPAGHLRRVRVADRVGVGLRARDGHPRGPADAVRTVRPSPRRAGHPRAPGRGPAIPAAAAGTPAGQAEARRGPWLGPPQGQRVLQRQLLRHHQRALPHPHAVQHPSPSSA